jgi:ABC-type multidrug transport system ATPase subunit
VIELRNVTKVYRSPLLPLRRAVCALEGLSLHVAPGEVLGVAGPNGAGKSTLLNLLLGYLEPTSGSVTVGGCAPRTYVEQYGIGYVPETLAIPPHWTLEGALLRYALLAGVVEAELHARVEAVIDLLEIGEHCGKRIRQLSKGNVQRLGIAQALLRDHDVLVFDEPTQGLDPLWTLRFRELVRSLRRPGRAMLVVSHSLDELERIADRVAIIHRGRLVRLVEVGTGPASLEQEFWDALDERAP